MTTVEPASLPYSLGDAIDWKLQAHNGRDCETDAIPLLARGRDRLETVNPFRINLFESASPTR